MIASRRRALSCGASAERPAGDENGDVRDPQDRHAPAARIRAVLGGSFWASAFKFTCERHPYEKALSLAYHEFRGGDFAAHLDAVVRAGPVHPGHMRYTINRRVVVNDFVRQVTLEADMARIAARPATIDLFARPPCKARPAPAPRRPDRGAEGNGPRAVSTGIRVAGLGAVLSVRVSARSSSQSSDDAAGPVARSAPLPLANDPRQGSRPSRRRASSR